MNEELLKRCIDQDLIIEKVQGGYFVNWDFLDTYEREMGSDELVKFIYSGGYKNGSIV